MIYPLVKTGLESLLSFSGLTQLSLTKRKGQLLILAYHNVVPTGEKTFGDTSLHLEQKQFADQLDALMMTHEIISLLQVTMREFQPSPTRPQAIITFDDAYTGAMTAGIHELATRNLPATVFVTPHFTTGKPFWWDLVASTSKGIPESDRKRALEHYAGKHELIINSGEPVYDTSRVNEVPKHARCANMKQLRESLRFDRLSVGSHTWSHPNLSKLSSDELVKELTTSQSWLKEHFPDRYIPAISYPYGKASESVWKATEAAGYTVGLMVDGGWTKDVWLNPYSLPRVNIPAGLSKSGFHLRSSGVLT